MIITTILLGIFDVSILVANSTNERVFASVMWLIATGLATIIDLKKPIEIIVVVVIIGITTSFFTKDFTHSNDIDTYNIILFLVLNFITIVTNGLKNVFCSRVCQNEDINKTTSITEKEFVASDNTIAFDENGNSIYFCPECGKMINHKTKCAECVIKSPEYAKSHFKKLVLVNNTSSSIAQIKELINATPIVPVSLENLIYRCKTRKEYDKANGQDVLIYSIINSINYYESQAATSINNKYNYEKFSLKSKQIREDAKFYPIPQDIHIHKNIFRLLENVELLKLSKRKHSRYCLHIQKIYSSPKGRTNLFTTYSYTDDVLMSEITNYKTNKSRMIANKTFIEIQRSAMSDSLRYDVMKRDGFRCQICGSTQNDGIKLHVDHIVPVSKGGLTEMGNLRTLCERCNMGKSNKYDPKGLN